MRMKRILPCFFIMVLLLTLSLNVMAQDIPDSSIERFSRLVHDHMAGLVIGDNHLITDAEAKALPYPLLPYELRKDIIVRGHISGFAKLCGLDWEGRNFEPYTDSLRTMKPPLNDYQMAFAIMLHGLSMQNAIETNKDEPCDAESKADFEKKLFKQ